MDFDPALLRTFVAVHETGGFTRAARRLHLTQSAVSHQIRRLEKQLGRPLLHRSTRQLTLTEDGDDFLRHARQILLSLDALTRRFLPSPVAGNVRFGVPETFMGERLPLLLAQFARRFPAVRLDVNVGTYLDLRAMVAAGELDLAVVLAAHGSDGEGTVLRQTRFVWAAAESFEPSADASLPLAFSPSPCINRAVGISALEGLPLTWHIAFTSPSTEGIRTAVQAGLGVAVMMSGEVHDDLRIVDGQYGLPPLPTADFALIWSDGGQTMAAQEFGQMLLDLHLSPSGELSQA